MSEKETSNQQLINDLRALLQAGKVTTQEDICAALEALGHVVNQSKVSRLIHKLNAIKSKNEHGEIVYRLPLEPAPAQTSSRLMDLILDIVHNETTIIVRTSPGAAQLVARILDYHKDQLEILGTIAGDDTIFIAPTSNRLIQNSLIKIKTLLF